MCEQENKKRERTRTRGELLVGFFSSIRDGLWKGDSEENEGLLESEDEGEEEDKQVEETGVQTEDDQIE